LYLKSGKIISESFFQLGGKMAYTVIKDKCIGCRICEKICPVNAIVVAGKKAEINPSLCTDCGICAERCPVNAITAGMPLEKVKNLPENIQEGRPESYKIQPRPMYGFNGGRGMGYGRGMGRRIGMGMRGQGRGMGGGRGMGKGGMGRGRGQGGGLGRGPSGYCVCPSCGTRVPHEPGVPCTSMKCPKCGATMVRE